MNSTTDKSVNGTKLKIDWVEIPEGAFKMGLIAEQAVELFGSPKLTWKTPQQNLYLPTFYISRFPITCSQFVEFLADAHPDRNQRPNDYPGFAKHPMYADYQFALEFCAWAGVRLPTSEEWEKAARGTDGRLFPWGNVWDAERGNFGQLNRRGGVGSRKTTDVDVYPEGASPYGVMDMVGNCYEWTSTVLRIGDKEKRVIRGSDTDKSAIVPNAHCVANIMFGGLTPASYPPNTGFRVVIDKLPSE